MNPNNTPPAARWDITNTPDGDIELQTGDLAYSEATGQHKRDILLAEKGHYKESPAVGVGAVGFVADTDPQNFYRTIRKQMTRDGMKVKNVEMSGDNLIIDAEYETTGQ